MRIHEYYRQLANINLNGSIAALIPTIMIVSANLWFINNREIMVLTIPFFIYSLICFQIYLFRLKQSVAISRNMAKSESGHGSIFDVRHLLVFYMTIPSSRLLLYFPDGHLAGLIKRHSEKGLKRLSHSKTYVLYNLEEEAIAFYVVKRKRTISIKVYDQNKELLGTFEKKNQGSRNHKKEFLDATGRHLGAVEGSSVFMDEQVLNNKRQQVGRLRRGWMPLEWNPLFPEPNTPVLSFREVLSNKDKLLRMSLLINEYFIER
jgi:hypothetical protein